MTTFNYRPSWEEYFAEIVSVTAKRSPCERLKVGCLLVKDNRIISQGYNGFLPGCPHESMIIDGHEQATVHAEQNAITDCAKRGVSCDGSDAYITHYPCKNCTKLLIASGIKNIYYVNDYRNDEDDVVKYFSTVSGVNIKQLSPVLTHEQIVNKMQNECQHEYVRDPYRVWGEKPDMICKFCGKYK